ncbi:TRAP transporter large permease [Chloroflexota bacterium]
MSLELMALITIGGLVLLVFIGLEVFAAVGIIAAIGLLFFVGQPLGQFPHFAFTSMDSFVLTAVPLFIFMGAIIANSGIVRSLFAAVNKLVGNFPGGIVTSVIAVNAVFGAMCGSALAATATFGKFAYPEMESLGYNQKLSLGTLAVGGILSTTIPPSAILIVYGAWSETSVPRLFAGVLIPGIILALLFMLTIIVKVLLNPSLVPKPPTSTWGEKLIAIRNLLPWLMVILIVLGVIFGGVMTPTEAAAMGGFLSIALALAYRRMSLAVLLESMWTAVKITSMIAFLIFTAKVLGQVFIYIGLVDLFSAYMAGLPFGRYGIIATLALMYLIGGMFIDDWSLLLLSIPFVLPVITGLGLTRIWFGVWYVMLAGAALITPPFGLNLFVLKSVVPKHDVMTIALGALPFLIPMLIVVALLTVFPELALWLPNLLYSR